MLLRTECLSRMRIENRMGGRHNGKLYTLMISVMRLPVNRWTDTSENITFPHIYVCGQ